MKFGERFSGINAPLTEAIADAGIATQEPFDKDRNEHFDFFTEEGKAILKDMDADPELHAVRWAPECRFMSRARANP